MSSSKEFDKKDEPEEVRNNLYNSLPPGIRAIIQKPFKCPICGMRFEAAQKVQEHKTTEHSSI